MKEMEIGDVVNYHEFTKQINWWHNESGTKFERGIFDIPSRVAVWDSSNEECDPWQYTGCINAKVVGIDTRTVWIPDDEIDVRTYRLELTDERGDD